MFPREYIFIYIIYYYIILLFIILFILYSAIKFHKKIRI